MSKVSKSEKENEIMKTVINSMEHAVAVFNSKGLLKLDKMREQQANVNQNFIV